MFALGMLLGVAVVAASTTAFVHWYFYCPPYVTEGNQ